MIAMRSSRLLPLPPQGTAGGLGALSLLQPCGGSRGQEGGLQPASQSHGPRAVATRRPAGVSRVLVQADPGPSSGQPGALHPLTPFLCLAEVLLAFTSSGQVVPLGLSQPPGTDQAPLASWRGGTQAAPAALGALTASFSTVSKTEMKVNRRMDLVGAKLS